MRRSVVHPLFVIFAAAVVWASVHVGYRAFRTEVPSRSFRDTELRCAIQLDRYERHLPGLTAGYNYELLQRFASDMGDSVVTIINPLPGSSWTDSLLAGRVDIVVLPYSGSPAPDSLLYSRPLDSLTVWAVREDCMAGLEEIDGWLEAFQASEGHESLRDGFLLRYSPAKRAEWGRRVSSISPYDSLVQAGSKRLGWDWRLLSAVVYQESQFHIELRSRRGAEGLMQMMPVTAEKMGVTDLFNPEKNIEAGTKYLLRLQNMFRESAANEEELMKFTLAAYNAGEGRLWDCINYAAAVGADATTWEGLLSAIPEMRDQATVQVDSILKLGTFQGVETIAYVEKVLGLYEDFKIIRP